MRLETISDVYEYILAHINVNFFKNVKYLKSALKFNPFDLNFPLRKKIYSDY